MHRILLLMCLSALLALPVTAHPGDTDSAGGHTDWDTGEYHYHHGYSAHDHEDLDGDGDLDCPYDFDDQTGQSSGTTSVDSPSGTTYWQGYFDGKHYGYNSGKEDGYQNGLEDGHTAGYEAGYADAERTTKTTGRWAAGIAGILLLFLSYRRGKRHSEEIKQLREEYRQKLSCLQTEHEQAVSQKDQQHRQEIAGLLEQHTSELEARTTSVKRDVTMLTFQKDSEIAALTAKVEQCRSALEDARLRHADELRRLEAASRETRLRGFLSHFYPDDLSDLQIPEDAELCGGTVSVGRTSRVKPFGDLTVYTTPNGKCYHSARGCCGAKIPNNRYDLIRLSVPACFKCSTLQDFHSHCPEWYIRYKEIISRDFKDGR